jgi:hypothetical protein
MSARAIRYDSVCSLLLSPLDEIFLLNILSEKTKHIHSRTTISVASPFGLSIGYSLPHAGRNPCYYEIDAERAIKARGIVSPTRFSKPLKTVVRVQEYIGIIDPNLIRSGRHVRVHRIANFSLKSSDDPSLRAPLHRKRYRKVRADTELAGVNPLIGMPRVSHSRAVSSTRGIRACSGFDLYCCQVPLRSGPTKRLTER